MGLIKCRGKNRNVYRMWYKYNNSKRGKLELKNTINIRENIKLITQNKIDTQCDEPRRLLDF